MSALFSRSLTTSSINLILASISPAQHTKTCIIVGVYLTHVGPNAQNAQEISNCISNSIEYYIEIHHNDHRIEQPWRV